MAKANPALSGAVAAMQRDKTDSKSLSSSESKISSPPPAGSPHGIFSSPIAQQRYVGSRLKSKIDPSSGAAKTVNVKAMQHLDLGPGVELNVKNLVLPDLRPISDDVLGEGFLEPKPGSISELVPPYHLQEVPTTAEYDDLTASCQSLGYKKYTPSRRVTSDIRDLIFALAMISPRSDAVPGTAGVDHSVQIQNLCRRWAIDLATPSVRLVISTADIRKMEKFLLESRVLGCANPSAINYYCNEWKEN